MDFINIFSFKVAYQHKFDISIYLSYKDKIFRDICANNIDTLNFLCYIIISTQVTRVLIK